MESENKKKLQEMLSTYDSRKAKIQKEIEKQENNRENFIDTFENFADTVIKPIMIEIGDSLKVMGHDYKITYQRECKDEKVVVIDSRITMDIFPDGKGQGSYGNVPAHILFYTDKFSEKIGIHENNIVPQGGGGSAGRRTYQYEIQTLTPQTIEKEIIESIGNILRIS